MTTVAVLVVAAVAASASYQHMRDLALEAGEGARAKWLPLSVDGLMVAASMSLLVRKRAGEPAGLAWFALGLGATVSVLANVAAAEPTFVGRLVAMWPPLALVVAYELLMQQVKNRSAGAEVGRQERSRTSDPRLGGSDNGTNPNRRGAPSG